MLKTIPNFNSYAVTDDGLVWSKRNYCWLKPKEKIPKTGKNYLSVHLCGVEKKVWKSIHRLVLEAFVSPCPDGMECMHLNGNKQDNRLENLCWGTKSENIKNAVQKGIHPAANQNGSKNPLAKLTEQDVLLIRSVYNKRLNGYRRWNQHQLAKKFNVSRSLVGMIVRREIWRHI